MIAQFHRSMTQAAFSNRVSQVALKYIIQANLGQDSLKGLVGHPEFHFDNSAFIEGQVYLSEQKELILSSLKNQDAIASWKAFGRITHAVQDFYAHSNYVRLWVQKHPKIPAAEIDPLESGIIDHPGLRSGRVYAPWEVLTYLPLLGKGSRYLLPRDAHTWMNLDSPARGPLFEYARNAATKRTMIEFDLLIDLLKQMKGDLLVEHFTDLSGSVSE